MVRRLDEFVLTYCRIPGDVRMYLNRRRGRALLRRWRGVSVAPDETLLVGNSLIEFWQWDGDPGLLLPWRVVNRGIAGSQTKDLVSWADDLIGGPRPPRVVVLWSGEVEMHWCGASPEDVALNCERWCDALERRSASSVTLFLSILPHRQRACPRCAMDCEASAKRRAANALIKSMCEAAPRTRCYVDLLTGGELLEDRCYRPDGHLSRSGYAVLAAKLRPVLAQAHG